MTHNPIHHTSLYIPSHNPNSSTLLPILLKTTHPTTTLIPIIIMFFPILPHPRIPFFFFTSNERLKSMLLASSEVDGGGLPLSYGFGYEDVFDT